MTMYTAAQGEVVDAPIGVTTDTGASTVLVLRDTRSGDSGVLRGLSEPGVEYQVCLREPDLGRRVLEQVRLGDKLVVLGTMQLYAPAGPLEDALSGARVSLDAVAIGVDLGPA
jgi:hypothetical protein